MEKINKTERIIMMNFSVLFAIFVARNNIADKKIKTKSFWERFVGSIPVCCEIKSRAWEE